MTSGPIWSSTCHIPVSVRVFWRRWATLPVRVLALKLAALTFAMVV